MHTGARGGPCESHTDLLSFEVSSADFQLTDVAGDLLMVIVEHLDATATRRLAQTCRALYGYVCTAPTLCPASYTLKQDPDIAPTTELYIRSRGRLQGLRRLTLACILYALPQQTATGPFANATQAADLAAIRYGLVDSEEAIGVVDQADRLFRGASSLEAVTIHVSPSAMYLCAIMDRLCSNCSQTLATLAISKTAELADLAPLRMLAPCTNLRELSLYAIVDDLTRNLKCALIYYDSGPYPTVHGATEDEIGFEQNHHCSIDWSDLTYLRHLTSLQELRLTVRSRCGPTVADFTRGFSGLCKLRLLDLSGCTWLSTKILEVAAASCPLLEHAIVDECRRLTVDALVHVATHCKLLQTLWACRYNCDTRAELLGVVNRRSPEPRAIPMPNCPVLVAAARTLAQRAPKLESLSLYVYDTGVHGFFQGAQLAALRVSSI